MRPETKSPPPEPRTPAAGPSFTPRLLAVEHALAQALGQHHPRRIPGTQAKPAAVLMPLRDDGEVVSMIFTKRTATLPDHPGQISFPGGRAETTDPDLAATALRETHEEIGVAPWEVRLLARQDQVVTVTNYLVTPYLGMVAGEARFHLNTWEVARLVEVPFVKVLDPAAYQQVVIDWRGVKLPQTALIQGEDVIWGATHRMLQNFLAALGPEGLARVARAAV
ncbi:MAG: CoA pyrophosphatase [Deltaproteobacteria bacterium]|nr:CoA pyrophosphatase [Deltaproteobacteria bacterium]